MGPTNRTQVRGAARLAAILDALPDALLLVDANDTIVNANAAALQLFEGESAERLLGRQISLVLPGIGRAVATPGSAPAALPAGPGAPTAAEVLGGAGAVRRPPERMAARRTDGSVFPAEVTTAELREDDDSDLTLLVVRDLSGVLDVEAELRRQQRQIELILRAASEGIIGVDHEGRIVLVNPAGAKILRYRAADLGGQNVHDLLTHSRADGTPLPEAESPLVDSVRTGAKHRAVDCVLWRSDGGPVYVDLTTAPVYEGENIIGAVMTFVDNSASRTAARQTAELTNVLDKDLRGALGEAAARLHEIVEYGETGYGPASIGGAALPLLEEVCADLDRLTVLAADVVDFQQSVVGALDYEPEPVELSVLVDAAVSEAAPAAGAAGVELVAHCAEVEVELDPQLFTKLLVHLLADMVSVSPVGGKIVVTAARRGSLARMEIRGPHTGGGPLHLPIAQAVAARHGGTVTTHRIAGKGNTHVVEVPVTQPARAAVAKARKEKDEVAPASAPRALEAAGGTHTTPGTRGAGVGVGPANPAGRATGVGGNAVGPAPAEIEAEHEVGQANGHPVQSPAAQPQYGAQRRRRAAPASPAAESAAKIPTQSRSTLSRSVGSIADLKPSRPMPTGDVWSKPDRSLTAEPPPPSLDVETQDGLATSGAHARGESRHAASAQTSAPEPAVLEPELEAVAAATATAGPAEAETVQPWRAEPVRPEPTEAPESMMPPAQAVPSQKRPAQQQAAARPTQATYSARPAQRAQSAQSAEPTQSQQTPLEPAEQTLSGTYVIAPRGRRRASNADSVIDVESTQRVDPSMLPTKEEIEQMRAARTAANLAPVPPMAPMPATGSVPIAEIQNRAAMAIEPPAAPEQEPEQPRLPEPKPAAPVSDGPRLLLWPDPDGDTTELLRERGYEPVPLGQPDRLPTVAANGSDRPHPFAVFVDPIAAPITRRGLRELRAGAARAELPLLVTAGIGWAADGRELGPDPSLLLTALCPEGVRLPRVLLVEARIDLAEAISEILERQGMQVAHATTDAESRESAVAAPPDLVLLDLMQIRRRRVGVVDWLRDRGLLSRTPLVVYTAEGSDAQDGGFDSLYLTERATDAEPAGRIGDLLAKIAP